VIHRDLNRRPTYECRCDERLQSKVEGSTRLTRTGWSGELEHLKIKTWLIDERLVSVMGECVIVTL
jgi:hypothetical protein